MKIYTKTGDAGETGLFDGARVSKADARIAACGDVDELNACLGLVRAQAIDADLNDMLEQMQRDLFALGAALADPRGRISARVKKTALGPDAVARLEGWIDVLEAGLPPLRHFLLAGGAPAGAWLHFGRAVCRRAERQIVALGAATVDPHVLAYVNRVSDLLFVMARTANVRAGIPETEW